MTRRRGRLLSVAAPAIYVALSIAMYGRGVVRDPSGSIVGDDGADKTIFLWGLGWLPHALSRSCDPFSSEAIWAPHGTDLAWVTWTPAAAAVAWPVTALFGVVVAYNVLALAAPAVAAWTCFLFLRELCDRGDIALLGGATFGFSSFVTVHTIGHLHLTLCFLLPVCALLGVRRFRRRLSRNWFVAGLAATLTVQLLLSTEVAVTLVLFGAAATVVAWTQLDNVRRAILRRVALESALALCLAAIATAPLLVHALVIAGTEAQPQRSPFRAATDMANLVVPTRRTLLEPPGSSAIVERFTAGGAERVGYLGLPLVAAVAAFAFSARGRSAAGRTVLLTFGVVLISTFGPRLRLAGVTAVPGPWALPAHLPVLDGVKPARLMVYAALLASAVLCLWVADRPASHWRWAVAVLAVVALVPNPERSLWTAHVPRPTFFQEGHSAEALARGETVLVLPYGASGWSMLWQAEDSFRYRLIGGHIGKRTTVAESAWDDVYRALSGSRTVSTARLRRFLHAHRVGAIVVTSETPLVVARAIVNLGLPVERRYDALVYRLMMVTSPLMFDSCK